MSRIKQSRGKPTGPQTPKAVIKKRAQRKRRWKTNVGSAANEDTDEKKLPGNKPLLDAIMPSRKRDFVPRDKCKNVRMEVNVSRFSFLDNPQGTLRKLREIIHANSVCEAHKINFTDPVCFDIAPYLVLTLMGKELDQDRSAGGRITTPVQRILEETEFTKHFDMKPVSQSDTSFSLWPIAMQRCRQSPPETQSGLNSPHADLADKFTQEIEKWLAQAGFGLKPEGMNALMTMMAEVLNNAMIHSREDCSGEAWVSGFMVVHDIVDGEPEYLCHISVINMGKSIHESMQTCSTELKAAINDLIRSHSKFFPVRPYWTPEALWTLYALQEGVTRLDREEFPKGGKGLMDTIQFFSEIGQTDRESHQPKMVLLSGNVGIIIENPVIGRAENGMRKIALNPTNDLYKPPSKENVIQLKQGFPGTILSWRFYLNKTHLKRLIENAREQNAR